MTRRRRPRFKARLDHLEDRVVPSIDLAQVDTQIGAAFGSFATSLRQAELTLSATVNPANTEGTGNIPATEMGVLAGELLSTLQGSVASSLAGAPAASSLLQGRLGTSGLGLQLATIYGTAAAGTPDFTIPRALLPVVYPAVEAAVSAAYQEAQADAYIAAITPPAGLIVITIPTPVTATGPTIAAQVQAGVTNLEQSINVAAGLAPTASALIQSIGNSGVGGLDATLTSLFTASASGTVDGSIPGSVQPLLFAAVELAINAYLQQVEGAIFLDVSGQSKGSSVNLAAITTLVESAFTTFATAIRTAEVAIYMPIPGGPPGGPPRGNPPIAVVGFTTTASTTATATGQFVVNLAGPSMTPVTVQYATSDGTAIAGTDYTAASGTLTFAPGVTSETVPVTILASSATSGNKTLTLTLSNPTGATLSTTSATGTIAFGTTTVTTTALTPQVTQGPYFQDFTDASLDRADLTSGTTRTSVIDGVPLALTLNVYQVSGTTVTPMSGVRVDLWHADAIGVYSDETSEGTSGQTYLRGYQSTNASGSVTFSTIIPGWYSGRTPHIHFMVRSGTTTLTNLVTSQLFFDQTFIDSLYTSASAYVARGLPDTTNASDMVYNTATTTGGIAGPSLLLNLTKSASGGYSATFNVYVAAS